MYKLLIILNIFVSILYADINCSVKQEFKVICQDEIKEIIKNQTTEILHNNMSNVINYYVVFFTALMAFIMIYGIIVDLRKNSFKEELKFIKEDIYTFKKDIDEKISNKIHHLSNDLKDNVQQGIEGFFSKEFEPIVKKNIEENISLFSKYISDKENYKNKVLYTLNQFFYKELEDAQDDNYKELAHNWYNERVYIVNKLAYGDKEQIINTLKELQGSSAKDLLEFGTFKKFLELLSFISKDDIEIDTAVKELLKIRKV